MQWLDSYFPRNWTSDLVVEARKKYIFKSNYHNFTQLITHHGVPKTKCRKFMYNRATIPNLNIFHFMFDHHVEKKLYTR